jgi:dihydroorotase
MKLLIKNGHLVDPKNKINSKRDILLNAGKVERISEKITAEKDMEVIDAEGLIVAPGFIDMHVHLREPGREDKETIATATRAAARGGMTSIVGMPNTTPNSDDQTVIGYIMAMAAKEGIVNVYPVGSLTKHSEGKELSQIGDLKRAGAIAVSDDGRGLKSAALMNKIMEYLKKFQLPIISHSEDDDFGDEWTMHEGLVSTRLGLAGKPAAAEDVIIARDIVLSESTGYPVHFTHINSTASVKMIRDAKKRGIKVTSDTCPQYFLLTDEAVSGYNPMAKMNPPLRPKEHLDEIKKGLQDGTIDAISTDHAPHLLVEKYYEFEDCANGIVGLETSIPLVMTHLVDKKLISIEDMVRLMSSEPANILKLNNKGHLSIGADADVTIIDPEKEETIDKNLFESKGKNTPFDGWNVKGLPVYTIVAGKIVMKDRKIVV